MYKYSYKMTVVGAGEPEIITGECLAKSREKALENINRLNLTPELPDGRLAFVVMLVPADS